MALSDRVSQRANGITRADPITLEEFGYLLGADAGTAGKTKSGVSVGVNRALGLTSWYSGVRYIAETLAGLPCFPYRDVGGDRSRRARPIWMERPDAELPWFGLVEFWLMSLLNRGNAYAYKLRSPAGQVVGLRPLHPDRVKPGQTADGFKVFRLDNDESMGYTAREILHIPGLSYDGVVGLNPIAIHAESLGTAAAADEYAGRFFGNGTHERSYLSIPQTLTVEQAKEHKEQWERFHKGLMNAHEFGVLGGGAELKTIGLDPAQTQLLESRKFGVTEVARMLRLPPHKLYDLERATFSNIEHQSIEAVVDGIRPWATRIEAWVNFDPDLLVPGDFLEFQLEGLLRGDIASRFEAYSKGIQGGFMMPSEPRRLENLPKIDGSEYLLRPLNMVQIGPDAVEGAPDKEGRQLSTAEILQKGYLAVQANVITADELRQIANVAGQAPPSKEVSSAQAP